MMMGCLGKAVGLGLIFLGFWIGLTPLAFATMIGPNLQGQAWWDEYWTRIFLKGGWVGVAMGLAMVIVGGILVVSPLRPNVGVKSVGPKKSPRDPEIA